MHVKGKYSWLKHLDFMVLDILSLAVAFVMAIGIRFGDFSLVTSDSWKTLLLIACLMDLLVILFTNPFSGIFRRYGSEELLKTAALTGYNGILLFLLLYGRWCLRGKRFVIRLNGFCLLPVWHFIKLLLRCCSYIVLNR